jgi:hypothetical protein
MLIISGEKDHTVPRAISDALLAVAGSVGLLNGIRFGGRNFV